jgi:hypothetical protein
MGERQGLAATVLVIGAAGKTMYGGCWTKCPYPELLWFGLRSHRTPQATFLLVGAHTCCRHAALDIVLMVIA